MTINVVYLSYFSSSPQYGLEALENFLESYKNKEAGIEHSLTILAKNWTDKISYEKLCNLAEECGARVIDLPDDGWDFGAYFRAAKILNDDYLFFIGTACIIYADNWLLNSYNAFKNDESVQLVGAMGSYGYIKDVEAEVFPNFHIRTCAFMMKRELFLEYVSTQKFPETKEDTYQIEHGENSLTKFVLNKGYDAVVVNCDGEVFSAPSWVFSETYRSPGKMKSIIVDKHSYFYYTSDDTIRGLLERAAWGWNLMDTKIKIFVSYHKLAPRLESEVFQPIFNGADEAKNNIFALKDNIGINISEKNHSYHELTGHYWIWKNILPYINTLYIGFSQYHRFLDFNLSLDNSTLFSRVQIEEFTEMCAKYSEENIMKCVQDFDVVLPQKGALQSSVAETFLQIFSQKDLDLISEIIEENYPQYSKVIKKVLSEKSLYTNLVFIMKRELLSEYMEWLFNILPSLETKISCKISDVAEILFNIWLNHNIEVKQLRIKETSSIFIEGI